MKESETTGHKEEDLEGFAGEDAPWMWGIVLSMILILVILGIVVLLVF